jgi:hypothetical protein
MVQLERGQAYVWPFAFGANGHFGKNVQEDVKFVHFIPQARAATLYHH